MMNTLSKAEGYVHARSKSVTGNWQVKNDSSDTASELTAGDKIFFTKKNIILN